MVLPQQAELTKEIDAAKFYGQLRVLGQDDDARKPLAMSENLLQGQARVSGPGFHRLKRIGAVRQMDRGRRHVKPFKVRHVFQEHLCEVPLRRGLRRLIGSGIAVRASVGAPRIDVDAVSVPTRKSVLMGERAVPLDDSWPGGAQYGFAGSVGQKIPGKRCLLWRGFPGPDRSISLVDPVNEVFDRTSLVLEEPIHTFPRPACRPLGRPTQAMDDINCNGADVRKSSQSSHPLDTPRNRV